MSILRDEPALVPYYWKICKYLNLGKIFLTNIDKIIFIKEPILRGTYWTALRDASRERVSLLRKVTQLVNNSNAGTEFGKLAIVM